ncbi:aldehyde dehydrogenase family protein [Phenylobacterium sp. LjRoot225]|uniref:aldehyde dehydrogenase family protein n=1 Tax=Phenylobacterium sp. LjRoot225 TaxID=3342285 RepID=UPI003ED0F85A
MDWRSDYRMTIGGELVSAAETIEVINPATGAAFATAPRAAREDLDRAVAAAALAQKSWRRTPIAERRERLLLAGELLRGHVAEAGRLFTLEQGRPLPLAEYEIAGAAAWLEAVAARELPVEVTEDSDVRRIEVHHEPLGVVCAIVPWNFPVSLAMWKVAPALLAGNTMVLKPSPFTPLCMLKIAELLREVLPPGVLNVISGGDELGPWMTAHEGFAKISFTGSTATGKRVMEAAAKDLKRVTLELGGNDAAIVLADVDVEKVASRIFQGAFFNSAQLCVATKRLYVHEAVYDRLRDALVALAGSARVGDGLEPGVGFGPIQNRPQYERVLKLIDEARAAGLTLLQGPAPSGPGYFVPLTIVDDPPETARVVTEEAFGPILPMMRFKDLDEVIGRANDSEYGLAGAVWSSDVASAVEVAHQLETGTVWINENLHLPAHTPFGGHKQSGFGVENGLSGLLEFTRPKSIYISKPRPAPARSA